MNISQIKRSLPYLFKARITPMIVGQHGVGKSTAIREFCQENEMVFVDLRLGSMDVGDLLGLPDFQVNEAGNKIATQFMQPDWFPKDSSRPGIIFLDEINRARRDVLQAIFQLVLDRKMHDKELPDNWHVVAACNPDTEDYTTTDVSDKAFVDRFCWIKLTSTFEDFIQYGKTKGFDNNVLSFINSQPTLLRGVNKDFSLSNVEPSDRSWEKVSHLLKCKIEDKAILNELIMGLVGTEASTAYLAHEERQEKPLSGKDIVMNYKRFKDQVLKQASVENYRSDLLDDTSKQVHDYLVERNGDITDKEYRNMIEFAEDIPNDICFSFLQKLVIHQAIFLKMKDETGLLNKLRGYKKPAKKEEN